MLCNAQAFLDDLLTRPDVGYDESGGLSSVLRKAYNQLPCDEHRRMFLDAAILLRGKHVLHLEALWGGQLLQDTTPGAKRMVNCPRKREAGRWVESPAEHRRRQQDVANRCAANMISCLQDMSLVQLDKYRRSVVKHDART